MTDARGVLPARRAPRRRDLLVAAALVLCLSAPLGSLAAQAPPRQADPWRPTRVAKWTLLAVAAGFGAWAWHQNGQAEDAFADLRRRCERDAASCRIEDGRYADPASEALYDRANALDRRAQVGIIGGQAALVGSAAFFILDLRNGGSPENIPYDPSRRAGAALRAGLRAGLRLRF